MLEFYPFPQAFHIYSQLAPWHVHMCSYLKLSIPQIKLMFYYKLPAKQNKHKNKKKKSNVTVIVEAFIFYCKLCPSNKLPKSLILERR